MKYYVDGRTEIQVPGETVAQALDALMAQHPSIKTHILDNHGNIRRHVNLFVNKENIRTLDGVNTKVNDTDKIILMPSISGG